MTAIYYEQHYWQFCGIVLTKVSFHCGHMTVSNDMSFRQKV